MQAVLKFPSKCSFSPPLTRVSAVLSASGHPQPPSSKENSDFWGQSQKYVAIGSAQCRHRQREDSPEGMLLPAPPERNIRRPFLSDLVPAKQKFLMYIHSDRLTNLSQSTALVTKSRTQHPARHKAPHSAYTPAECLKHAAQATPKGLLRMLYA